MFKNEVGLLDKITSRPQVKTPSKCLRLSFLFKNFEIIKEIKDENSLWK